MIFLASYGSSQFTSDYKTNGNVELQGSVPIYPEDSNVQVTAGKRHSPAFFERPAALWERNGKPSFDPVRDNLLLKQNTHISVASLTQHACVDSPYLPDTVIGTELHIAGNQENILGNCYYMLALSLREPTHISSWPKKYWPRQAFSVMQDCCSSVTTLT